MISFTLPDTETLSVPLELNVYVRPEPDPGAVDIDIPEQPLLELETHPIFMCQVPITLPPQGVNVEGQEPLPYGVALPPPQPRTARNAPINLIGESRFMDHLVGR